MTFTFPVYTAFRRCLPVGEGFCNRLQCRCRLSRMFFGPPISPV